MVAGRWLAGGKVALFFPRPALFRRAWRGYFCSHARPTSCRFQALRDEAGTSGSDFCDGLSLSGLLSGGKQDSEPVVVEVSEASG